MNPDHTKLDNTPKELRDTPAWVLWRIEERDGKPTKFPYQANGHWASSTDPSTWTTFEAARAALERDRNFHGLGFVFHEDNGYAGVDLDGVSEDSPEAGEWLFLFASYAERSPSGNGLHIIFKGELPQGTKRAEGELYSSGRFFTMTGDVVRDLPIREAQEAAEKFYAHLRADDAPATSSTPSSTRAATPAMSDDEVIRRAEAARDGGKFRNVYAGSLDYHPGKSERDASLAWLLAFWTQDADQIERIMRGSGCERPKWNERRGTTTWLGQEIGRAIDGRTETYAGTASLGATLSANGSAAHGAAGNEATSEATPNASDTFGGYQRVDLRGPVERGVEPPDMLVDDILYAGRVHCIYSGGGTGKTFMALWLIGCTLRQRKRVVLLDHENGVKIISDRLRDLGIPGELIEEYLYYFPFPSMPLSPDASASFEAMLDGIEPELVVFDSWINCLAAAGLDENSSVDIAQWTEAYAQRARARGVAVLLLDHIPKAGGSARGSGRKLDYVDAMYELRNPVKFDRETVGEVGLLLRKDREGYLPRALTFSIGGTPDGFMLRRSEGAFHAPHEITLNSDRAALDALKDAGPHGCTAREWQEEVRVRGYGSSSFKRSVETLLNAGLVINPDRGQKGSRYRLAPDQDPSKSGPLGGVHDEARGPFNGPDPASEHAEGAKVETPANQRDHSGPFGSMVPNGPMPNTEGTIRVHTPRGGPNGPDRPDRVLAHRIEAETHTPDAPADTVTTVTPSSGPVEADTDSPDSQTHTHDDDCMCDECLPI
jgi:hypothetical protein